MAISRSQLLKELLPGLNGLFGLEYKRYGEEHKEIYEIENSDRSFEEEVKLSGFGAAPVKNEGAGVTYDTAQEAYTARWTHETISLGFAITEEAIEDNQYGSLSTRYTKALARAMAHTKQVKAAYILNNSIAAGVTYGDGQPLLSIAHPLVGGGVNSNRPAVHADLNETSLEAAIIAMSAWTDERGLMLAAKPKKLVIPAALQFVAERLLGTEKRVGTADNDISAIVKMSAIPGGYTVNHWLTSPTSWHILTDIPNGLKHFVRTKMTTEMQGDFETSNVRYRARERYSFGLGDPLCTYGSA